MCARRVSNRVFNTCLKVKRNNLIMAVCIVNAINRGSVYQLLLVYHFYLCQWSTCSSLQDNSAVPLDFVNKVLLVCRCPHLLMSCF